MSGLDFLKGFGRDRRRHLTGPDLDTLNLLANVVEGRDPYTAGHTWRVSRYVTAVAKHLDWKKERIASIELGALFHDLGKISTEDRILNKPGRLTREEFEKIKAHPAEGKHLLQGVEFLKPAVAEIYAHHEHYDGSGYPEGMKGDEIPLEGRVIAIANVFDPDQPSPLPQAH
jgi:putative two-component system response regulator